MMRLVLLPLAAVSLLQGAAPASAPSSASAPRQAAQQAPRAQVTAPLITATVVARYPHDTRAFTEGLLWRDGTLYESIGYEGRSEVRRVRLADGKVLARAAIPPQQFGEGLTAWKDQLVSLTWHDGIAHRWDRKTLKRIGENRYTGEGWGLTSSAADLVMSDGSAALRFLDPVTLAERRRVTVSLPNGRAIDQVNELEWVDGAVLANVWHTGFLLRIDPASGKVTAVVDLRPIVAEVKVTDPEAVLNGIAWDADGRRLFVTGKLWPTLFEVRLNG